MKYFQKRALGIIAIAILCQACSAFRPKASKKGIDGSFTDAKNKMSYGVGKLGEFAEEEVFLTEQPTVLPIENKEVETTYPAGTTNLKKLKPEQADVSLKQCLGVQWERNDAEARWRSKYDLAFSTNKFVAYNVALGGVDYVSQVKRSEETAQLMVLLLQRMGYEVCSASVDKEFKMEPAQRLWMGDVNENMGPDAQEGAVGTAIQNLYRGCLSRDPTLEETTAAKSLVQSTFSYEKNTASSLKAVCLALVSSGEFMFY
jgi:hypothetical protein